METHKHIPDIRRPQDAPRIACRLNTVFGTRGRVQASDRRSLGDRADRGRSPVRHGLPRHQGEDL
jgi:hypothetical protein